MIILGFHDHHSRKPIRNDTDLAYFNRSRESRHDACTESVDILCFLQAHKLRFAFGIRQISHQETHSAVHCVRKYVGLPAHGFECSCRIEIRLSSLGSDDILSGVWQGVRRARDRIFDQGSWLNGGRVANVWTYCEAWKGVWGARGGLVSWGYSLHGGQGALMLALMNPQRSLCIALALDCGAAHDHCVQRRWLNVRSQ